MRTMKPKTVKVPVIRTEKDLDEALVRVEYLMDNKGDGDEIELLGIVIKAYEDAHYPMSEPDPVESIKFAMDQHGYNYMDLARLLGATSRATEIMHRRRRLTVEMIRKLHKEWGIPLECLVGDSKARSA